MKIRGTGLQRNTVSYLGILTTAIGAFLTLFSLVLQRSLRTPSPYLGIFTYLIFPSIVALGGALILFGMWRESRRRRRLDTTEVLPYPSLDLNDSRTRRRFGYAAVGGLCLMVLFGFVGYNAFLFTESNTFCGKICHTVMEPEYEAYHQSPHARVHCVDCHVGSGASFFVRSKLSGVRQVINVVFHLYETPIPTPIENLRPAREVCEECHWPQKFYGAQLLQIPYFRYDEHNTSDQISLLVKTGGGSAKTGQSAGIHWHMIIDNAIEFVATDEKLQEIPWFRVVGSFGQEREYISQEDPITPEEVATLDKHIMDCMDCHNRPTHGFPPPDRAIDLALQNGHIPQDLPWVKKVTADALMAEYPDQQTAIREIRNKIFNFYATNYDELYERRKAEIETTVEVALNAYSRTVFPKMRVDWATYPENIGHRNWPGCFRCHDGKHATKEGKVLTKECTICHTMPQRGPLEELGAMPPATDVSWHPFPLTGKHADLLCSRCHSPGVRPIGECATCHHRSTDLPMGTMDCLSCHQHPGEKQPTADCTACHDQMTGAHADGAHPDMACLDCHTPHAWSVTDAAVCLGCHELAEDHEDEGYFCTKCHEFTEG